MISLKLMQPLQLALCALRIIQLINCCNLAHQLDDIIQIGIFTDSQIALQALHFSLEFNSAF